MYTARSSVCIWFLTVTEKGKLSIVPSIVIVGLLYISREMWNCYVPLLGRSIKYDHYFNEIIIESKTFQSK